jgi:DNA-binding transcriptional LysR family regulator
MPVPGDLGSTVRLNYRQLEAFRAVMETGTVTAASQALSISQPSLSAHIANLEHDLKLTLFHRRNGRLVPTAEGHMLLPEVDYLVRSMARLRTLATDMRGLQSGRISIASYPAISEFVTKFVASFASRHERATFNLRTNASERNGELAASRLVDVGLTAMPIADPSVACELITETPSVCIVPNGHRLASLTTISPHDLRGEPFVALGRGDGYRQAVDAVFERSGVDLNIRFESTLSDTACRLVSDGAAVAIVDPFCASLWAKNLEIRAFNADVPCYVYAARNRNVEASLFLQSFIDGLREGFTSTFSAVKV